MKTQDNHSDLQAARADIDAVDDEIHRLLIRREEAVKKIIAAKGLTADAAHEAMPPVRFAREAQILRRLYDNHKQSGSRLSFVAVGRIWHELIAAYTLLQSDYAIAVTDSNLQALARSQFGDLIDITSATFDAEHGNRKILWVVPHPKISVGDGGGGEWLKLSGERDYKIVSVLPFVHEGEGDSAPLAYVIGTCQSDFSSADGRDDVLCLKLRFNTPPDLHDEGLMAVLAEHDICAIAASGDYLYCERHAALPGAEALSSGAWRKQLQMWQDEIAEVEQIEWLGTYAKPISVR